MSFSPQLTPVEMLQRGSFGHGYFHKAAEADYRKANAAI